MKRPLVAILIILALLLAVGGGWYFSNHPTSFDQKPLAFDGERALKNVEYQVKLGPRIPGSPAHHQVIDWITSELKKNGWTYEIQTGMEQNMTIQNVIGRHEQEAPLIILGAHFDTREFADQDPDNSKRSQPVPGANDGASGVAVLLELARVLPTDLQQQTWLVFLDAEDQGEINGKDWILGSSYFARKLSFKPESVVIIDMIGDSELNIYQEKNSTPELVQAIWSAAEKAGYSKQFIASLKYSMLDDHTPFLKRGFSAIDIIDFDYPYWHTTQDTVDKVSPQSLKAVGDTLIAWMESR